VEDRHRAAGKISANSLESAPNSIPICSSIMKMFTTNG
jgi:hypothetical protein